MDMTSSRFTTSRSLRRMRLRSGALPFFLVTVKPTRIGPWSERARLWRAKAALETRAPLATARKSARCLSRSMIIVPGGGPAEGSGSGTQTLAAARTAGSENLAAAGGGQARAKTVTALAHELAGLIGPLHGSISADIAIRPAGQSAVELRLRPMMLAGQSGRLRPQ